MQNQVFACEERKHITFRTVFLHVHSSAWSMRNATDLVNVWTASPL